MAKTDRGLARGASGTEVGSPVARNTSTLSAVSASTSRHSLLGKRFFSPEDACAYYEGKLRRRGAVAVAFFLSARMVRSGEGGKLLHV